MTKEEKMKIVINNYFKTECSVNTSIREAFEKGFRIGVQKGISAQPEITDEQAIEHLQSTGWMQNHDREMYDMGLKEQLADDSGSYDSLLPPAQPEIIMCKDCKRNIDNGGEYPDGRTRCPIQEHYALLQNGFCHLGER